jgi:hypothetical protein
VSDPIRHAAHRRRAAKQRQLRERREDEPPKERPYMTQGVRSMASRRRAPKTPDDVLRELAAELRGRPLWTRL